MTERKSPKRAPVRVAQAPRRRTRRQVWHPALYDDATHRAMQTVAEYMLGAVRPWPAGEEPPQLSPFDLKRVFDWIVHDVSQTYDNGTSASLDANDPQGRIAAFVDGRRSVGQQIVKLMTLKVGALEEAAA